MVIAYPQQVSSSKFHSLDIIFINISYPYFLGCDWRTDVCSRSSNAIGPESGGLQTCDLTRSYNFVSFLSNDYTNPNTNPKTLMASILTLTYPDDAFESFCALAFCDFILNYSRTDVCPLVTSYLAIFLFLPHLHVC